MVFKFPFFSWSIDIPLNVGCKSSGHFQFACHSRIGKKSHKKHANPIFYNFKLIHCNLIKTCIRQLYFTYIYFMVSVHGLSHSWQPPTLHQPSHPPSLLARPWSFLSPWSRWPTQSSLESAWTWHPAGWSRPPCTLASIWTRQHFKYSQCMSPSSHHSVL